MKIYPSTEVCPAFYKPCFEIEVSDRKSYWYKTTISTKAQMSSPFVREKTPIRQTLNLWMCAHSTTKKKLIMSPMSGVTGHVLCVTCHMWHVILHMSLTPTATAKDPIPANSPSKTFNKIKDVKTHFLSLKSL